MPCLCDRLQITVFDSLMLVIESHSEEPTGGREKWSSLCLYCGSSFQTDNPPVKRYSDDPGQYQDNEGHAIPLEYLQKDSDGWFHEKCHRRSERQAPNSATQSQARNTGNSRLLGGYEDEVVDDAENGAIGNLHLLATAAMSVTLPDSDLNLRETVAFEPPRPLLAERHGPLLRRTNTRCGPLFHSFLDSF